MGCLFVQRSVLKRDAGCERPPLVCFLFFELDNIWFETICRRQKNPCCANVCQLEKSVPDYVGWNTDMVRWDILPGE